MGVTLSRAVGFRAMHRLHRSEWPELENQRRFGWTAAPPGHLHHYRCTVTVGGPIREPLGMVMDLGLLDAILAEEVVARFGGRLLNTDVPEFGAVLPTCEAMARDVFRRVERRLPDGVTLVRVRIAEDASLYADYTGDD